MKTSLFKVLNMLLLAFAVGGFAPSQDSTPTPNASDAPMQSTPLTVVELFTSQGCSSCPPADAILRTMSSQPDLLTLSWAVDYWDRLGWEDTFGQQKHSRRQRTYNKRMGMGGAFTPQMVIDGKLTAVGSRKGEIRDAILSAQSERQTIATPTITRENGEVLLTLPAMPIDGPIAVNVVYYTNSALVDVGRGENKGRTLHYTNVVRHSETVLEWRGEAIKLMLKSARDAESKSYDYVAVLLQDSTVEGPIVGAARLQLSAKTQSGR